MYQVKLNKIGNLIEKIKNDINMPLIADFLEWFYEKLNIHFGNSISGLKLNKGEIYYVNLGKNIGSELNKTRPCMVYSDFFYNNGNTAVIIPFKSYKGKIKSGVNFYIKADNENKLEKDSVLDICSIRQVSKKRLKGYIGKMNKEIIEKIDKKTKQIFSIKK